MKRRQRDTTTERDWLDDLRVRVCLKLARLDGADLPTLARSAGVTPDELRKRAKT